jgi:hypothetical protein
MEKNHGAAIQMPHLQPVIFWHTLSKLYTARDEEKWKERK